VTTAGVSVLDTIAGRTPGLTGALLSSAARRALRPGPARTARTAAGSAPFGAVLQAAVQCPERPDAAAIRSNRRGSAGAIKKAIFAAVGEDGALARTILETLGENPSPGKLAAVLRALAPGRDGKPDPDAVQRALHQDRFPELDRSMLEWPRWIKEHARPKPCRPFALEKLSEVVAAAIDPTVARPPAVERVLSTLPGFKHIGPVELEPEIDLPLWSFLSSRSPDWMLPGVGDLIDGDVVALSTNPVFVQALLVGANHQATAELRWRNMPLVTRWSPLRKFWQRKSKDVDILPIKSWPTAAALGNTAMVPPERTTEAVVAFRTSLFRRYPATVVYLFPATADWKAPKPEDDMNAGRVLPTFTGTIGPDVTFFGFPLKPEALATHWVVLEEPPAGHRFFHQTKVARDMSFPAENSSNVAYQRFAVPVRVLIGPLL